MLIPLHCEYFALEGLADLVSTMRRVRAALNPALDIEGVLLTMFDERTNLGQQVATDVRGFFKEKVFRTVIPRNVRLGEAPSHGLPVILYDVKSRGAEAYLALAREVMERGARNRRRERPMEKRPALGKGLSALIPDAPEPRTSTLEVDVDRIVPNRFQPRGTDGRRAARRSGALDQSERRDPADRRPPRWRSLSHHRRRAPLARRPESRLAARAGRRPRRH